MSEKALSRQVERLRLAESRAVKAANARDVERRRAGAALRKEREARGIGLRELARRLGVSAAFICDLEHGRRWGDIAFHDACQLLGESHV